MSVAAADAAFLDAFDSGHSEGGVFGHREHLRLAWILICRHGLDAATPEIERRLRHLAAAGAIVVLATHDLDVADGLITRMAVVIRGRLASATEGGTSVREQYRALVGHA